MLTSVSLLVQPISIILYGIPIVAFCRFVLLLSPLVSKITGEVVRYLHLLTFGYLAYYAITSISGIDFSNISSLLVLDNWNNANDEYIIISTSSYDNDSIYSHIFLIINLITTALYFLSIVNRNSTTDVEYSALILIISFAAYILIVVDSFIDLFLALEIITLSSYALVSWNRTSRHSTYSGILYFLIGSVPSALFVFGLATVYKISGVITLFDYEFLRNGENIFISALLVLSVLGIIINLLFKLTAAPFSLWAPRIYGNAPLISVTYLSIFTKLVVARLVIKLILTVFSSYSYVLILFLLVTGVLSIIAAIIGSFVETLVKRFYVYSSIGHVGFILISAAVLNSGIFATLHYTIIYVISALLIWFLLSTMSNSVTSLGYFSKLGVNSKYLAFVVALLIFSISGVPPRAGFYIKLDVLYSLISNGNLLLASILFVSTVISFFYYIRVIKIMYFDATTGEVSLHAKFTSNVYLLGVITLLFLLLVSYAILTNTAVYNIVSQVIDIMC